MTTTAQSHAVKPMIGPSVLACDMSNLSSESARVLEAGADYLHLDVMDGHFVPNLTFGPPIIACLRKNHPRAILDTHLMVSNPEAWLDDCAKAGVDVFTFHVEVTSLGSDLTPFIQSIKAKGMKAGLAIKPGTPVESVLPYVSLLDQVLVMTVEPGFGGQKFMADMMPKVRTLRERFPSLEIQVDGGINNNNIDEVAKAGANSIVAGSAVFNNNPTVVINHLKRSVEKYGNGLSDEALTPLVVDPATSK